MTDILKESDIRTNDHTRILVLTSTILFMISCTLLVTTNHSFDYQVIIYNSYSNLFWFLYILSIQAAGVACFYSFIHNNGYWKHSIILLILSLIIYPFFPNFQNYYLYGRGVSDLLRHVGYTKTIIETGYIYSEDYYPIIHIWMGVFRFFGIEWDAIRAVMLSSSMPLFLIGTLLFVRKLNVNHATIGGITILSVPLYFGKFHTTTHPFMLSFFLLPISLYCLEGYRVDSNRSFFYPLIILSILFIYSHPTSSILFSIVISVSIVFHNIVSDGKLMDFNKGQSIVLIGTFIFSIWYLSFERFSRYIEYTSYSIISQINQIINSTGETTTDAPRKPLYEHILSALSSTNMAPEEIFIRFFELYGPAFMVISTGMCASILLVIRYYHNPSKQRDLFFVAHYVMGGAIAFLFMSIYVIAYHALRVSRYLILSSVLVSGYYLASSIGLKRVILVLLFLSAVPLSIMTSYEPHYHMTYTEDASIEWAIEYKNVEFSLHSILTSEKVIEYKKGIHKSSNTQLPPLATITDPDHRLRHLGYHNNKTLARTLEKTPSYLITKKSDIKDATYYTQNQLSEKVYYTKQDKLNMYSDTSVNKVYSNGNQDSQIWLIK